MANHTKFKSKHAVVKVTFFTANTNDGNLKRIIVPAIIPISDCGGVGTIHLGECYWAFSVNMPPVRHCEPAFSAGEAASKYA